MPPFLPLDYACLCDRRTRQVAYHCIPLKVQRPSAFEWLMNLARYKNWDLEFVPLTIHPRVSRTLLGIRRHVSNLPRYPNGSSQPCQPRVRYKLISPAWNVLIVQSSLGPSLIGMLLSTLLLGVCTCQGYIYMTTYKRYPCFFLEAFRGLTPFAETSFG